MAGQAASPILIRMHGYNVYNGGNMTVFPAESSSSVSSGTTTTAARRSRSVPNPRRMNSSSRRKSEPASFLKNLRQIFNTEDPTIINWESDGKITISDPSRLSQEILGRYFRHNQFSSFQRQLNYFGYYKISGKGKLERCVYTNDALPTNNNGEPGISAPPYPIDALLSLKRKSVNPSGGNAADKTNNSAKIRENRATGEKRSVSAVEEEDHNAYPGSIPQTAIVPNHHTGPTENLHENSTINRGLSSSLTSNSTVENGARGNKHILSDLSSKQEFDLPVHPVRKLSEATVELDDYMRDSNDANLKRPRSEPIDFQQDVQNQEFDEEDIFDWAVPLGHHPNDNDDDNEFGHPDDTSTSEYVALFCDHRDPNLLGGLSSSQPRRTLSQSCFSHDARSWGVGSGEGGQFDDCHNNFTHNSSGISTRDTLMSGLPRSLPTNPATLHMLPPPPPHHMNTDWNLNPSATVRLRSDLQPTRPTNDFAAEDDNIRISNDNNIFSHQSSETRHGGLFMSLHQGDRDNTTLKHRDEQQSNDMPSSEILKPTNLVLQSLIMDGSSMNNSSHSFQFSEPFQPSRSPH
uniref:HSF-type DNA-binding domain-containing protein n=1 Tax=Aureoumbra lagunensis TaxID=44058 RepID=A0A7S3JYV5_9STRA|mmetsp:Transcript_4587/g.6518  ORF Transcript_4587/g.6518 Transcript_4587/m.6518 type:complete len:576 (+) Transcript_4587:56-1783(+)